MQIIKVHNTVTCRELFFHLKLSTTRNKEKAIQRKIKNARVKKCFNAFQKSIFGIHFTISPS